jgi:hypothetical protein
LFGSGLKGGVYGNNPDFNDLDNGNLRHQFDYRQVYTTVLSDWMGAPDSAIVNTYFGDYLSQKLDLIANPLAINDLPEDYKGLNRLDDCYPNPADTYTTISYHIEEAGKVRLRIYNLSGRMVKEVVNQYQNSGSYSINADVTGLNSGNYIYRLEIGTYSKAKKLIVK